MTTNVIYIRLIDGADTWVPVKMKKVKDNQYEILDDNEFIDYTDPNYIFEFYPGDTVVLEQHTFSDGEKGLIAKKLVSKGKWKDRKFIEFKFKAAKGLLNIDKQTANMYSEEIYRVKEELLAGQFFYHAIIEMVEKLYDLLTETE